MKTPIVVVLGMHFSGTGTCSDVLRSLGVAMGEYGQENHGRAGDGANRSWFADTNAAVLGIVGRPWGLPAHKLHLPEEWLSDPRVQHARHEAAARLRSLGHARPVGLEDPAATILLPFWTQVFADVGVEPRYVFCVRHPGQVSAALQTHSNMERAQAEHHWLAYNAEGIRAIADAPVCVVPYGDWFGKFEKIADRLAHHAGLRPAAGAGTAMISGGRIEGPPEPASPLPMRLHDLLLRGARLKRFGKELQSLAILQSEFRRQIQPLLVDIEVARVGLGDQRRVVSDLQGLVGRLRSQRAGIGQ